MGTVVAADGRPEGTATHERRTVGRAQPWRPWLPGAALVVGALLLSLPRLGSRSLWLDEAYTVGATNQLFDTWRNTAGTQALYYLLVWPFSRASTELAWLRLPSAVFGAAAVVVVWRVARRIGGEREGLLAAGGFALSWGLARYAMEARSYTLALLLVSTAWLALIAAVQADTDRERRRWWRLFYVVTALVPLAHGLATLNFLAQLGALAVAPADQRHLLRRALRVAPVLAVELAVLFLLGAGEVGDWVQPLDWTQLLTFKQLLAGFGISGMAMVVLTAAAVLLGVQGYLRERSYDTWLRVVPVFWALGPPAMVLLMSLVRPYAAARYIFPSLPAIFLLLAALVVRMGAAKRVALGSVVVAALLLLDQPQVTTNSLEDWPGLTACIAANSAAGDRLMVGEQHRPPLDYYWQDHPELSQVSALSPPEPLGEVQRLYDSDVTDVESVRSTLTEDASESIWYVERGGAGLVVIAAMAYDREIDELYDIQRAWSFDGHLTLVRFDPAGTNRPRGSASCDTVDPQDD